MGPASGTSKLRLLVTENAERNFCLSCFLSDRLLSGGTDMVRGRPRMPPPVVLDILISHESIQQPATSPREDQSRKHNLYMHLKKGRPRQPFCNNTIYLPAHGKKGAKDAGVTAPQGLKFGCIVLNRCSVSYISPENMQSRKPKRQMLYKVQWLGDESSKHEY